MSNPSPDDASLAERLHSFFNVELPADPELAAQYRTDPQGTLADRFADLPQDALDDATYHFSQGTTANFAEGAGDALGPYDGESTYAYALRSSSESAIDVGPDSAGAPDEAFLDSGYADGLDAPLGAGIPEFGAGISSYAEADPSFADLTPSFDGSNAGADLGLHPTDLGSEHELPAASADNSAADGWDADLREAPGLDDDGSEFDSGLDG